MKIRIEVTAIGWCPWFRTETGISVFTDHVEYVVDMQLLNKGGRFVMRRGDTVVTRHRKGWRQEEIIVNDRVVAEIQQQINGFALIIGDKQYRVDPVTWAGEFCRPLGGRWISGNEAVLDNWMDYDIAAVLVYDAWHRRHHN